ncbi:MAG: hypothetical protein CVU30_17155 [Betaproteobacteria bacterium HGW-Betaproteobacteria-3]|jgi:hypothetical protein|nr:MAG: hypothetical protein CVU30_17155 [Betaproteobacteria bacterium HGW-Betaproteobacteria-3]
MQAIALTLYAARPAAVRRPARHGLVGLALTTACGLLLALSPVASRAEQQFPDVLAVKVHPRGADRFDFDVTVSSPYDTPRRYADAFRAASKDGRVWGERKLLHDHADEQPFTRDLYGVTVPAGVKSVVVQARDQKYGYGGKAVEVNLPGR